MVPVVQTAVSGRPPVSRFPGPASGACFGFPDSPWARSFAPSAPPEQMSPCSPTSRLSGRRRRSAGLASVRRSNGPYGFPVGRFHKGVSSRVQGRDQRNQSYKPVFANEPALREPFPAGVAPSLVTMRPDASHDPTVKLVEEPADMGLAVILAPPSNDLVDVVYQLLRTDRSLAPGRASERYVGHG